MNGKLPVRGEEDVGSLMIYLTCKCEVRTHEWPQRPGTNIFFRIPTLNVLVQDVHEGRSGRLETEGRELLLLRVLFVLIAASCRVLRFAHP